jgi:S1-C subfamily serine protease
MKKILTFVFLMSLLISSLSYCNFKEQTDIAVNLKKSTLVVVGMFEDGTYSVGTGFFIGDKNDGVFVTAFHVVAGAIKVAVDYGIDPDVTYDFNNPVRPTKVYPLETKKQYYWIDKKNDIIIFKVPNQLKIYPKYSLDINKSMPSVGSTVYTMGHTDALFFFQYAKGEVTGLYEGYFSTNFPNVSNGNSGGAVVDDNCEVRGMLVLKYLGTSAIQLNVSSEKIYTVYEDVKSGYGIAEATESLVNLRSEDEYHKYILPGLDNFFK